MSATRTVTLSATAVPTWTGLATAGSVLRQAFIDILHANGFGGGSDVVSILPTGLSQYIVTVTFRNLDCTYDLTILGQQLARMLVSTGYFTQVINYQFTVQSDAGCAPLGIGGSIGGGSESTYTVTSGDTMSRIAARYNMTLAQLMALNPQIRNANVISVGQVINVSGSGGGSLGIGGSIGGLLQLVTGFNTSTGQPTVTPVTTPPPANNPPPKEKDDRNWFDKTFFDGAGALTGVGIGVLIVLGAVVVTQYRNQ